MSADSGERMALIHDLDMQNQNNLHKTELIHRDEEARLLQLRMLSLRDENALLQDKLIRKDEQIESLARQCDKTRTELDCNKGLVCSKDSQLKKYTVELASLKAEVDSFNASIQKSSKTLQEKFALTRELERMRPEMEHLQSQLTNYQATVAEKHDLRRQLDSLEVELENEKRASQRGPSREVESVISELRSKLDRTEKELASEKKEQDRIKIDYERELAELRSHNERLEERISRLKMKLKGTQNELRETQAELQVHRSNLQETETVQRYPQDRTKGQLTTKSRSDGKRRTPELSMDDMAIPTPGHDDSFKKRPVRKRAAEHALLGEKSTFSITPFLNRTKGLADDSIEEVSYLASTAGSLSADREESSTIQAVDEPPSPEPVPNPDAVVAAPKPPKPRGRPKAKVLGEASASEKNRVAAPTKRSAGRKATPLDKVMEESHAQQETNSLSVTAHVKESVAQAREKEASCTAANSSILEVGTKRKKRKLLGGTNKTIFEDEDGETTQRPAKVQLGQTRRLKAPLGGVVNPYATGSTFSPLRRDRRGVNASFLA